MILATVSGSFHRHMQAIYEAVGELRLAGVDVLSPADPRVVDHMGDFLFVASDKLRSVKLVQDRHFEAIRASDFLLVVCPDGYTGPSTTMEIGYARAASIPVISVSPVFDVTVREYVSHVASISAAVRDVAKRETGTPRSQPSHLLIDPRNAVGDLHDTLDAMIPFLDGTRGDLDVDARRAIGKTRLEVRRVLGN